MYAPDFSQVPGTRLHRILSFRVERFERIFVLIAAPQTYAAAMMPMRQKPYAILAEVVQRI